jgi:hypothetical protein
MLSDKELDAIEARARGTPGAGSLVRFSAGDLAVVVSQLREDSLRLVSKLRRSRKVVEAAERFVRADRAVNLKTTDETVSAYEVAYAALREAVEKNSEG